MKRIILFLILSVVFFHTQAQDPLQDKFALYNKAIPQGKLYVHYDKNIYATGELVWFTGYLINSHDVTKHKLLSVSLIRESDNRVVFEERFEMKNGLGFGTIAIPDSISVGNYRLLAITDLQMNGKPEAEFTQYITVITHLAPPLRAKMNVLDIKGDNQKVVVYTTTPDSKFLKKPADIHYSYGSFKNTIKTDNSGRGVIDLVYQKNLSDPTLYVKITYENDSAFINMPIKEESISTSVNFFPESGDIVSNLANTIGWEVKDGNKQPISVIAYLYKDNQCIDTVRSNALGIGSFELFAEEGVNYTLRVAGNKGVTDTVFKLPAVKSDGVVLHVAKAVSSKEIVVALRAKKEQTVHLRLHNFRNIYAFAKLNLKPGQQALKLPVENLPKGVATITITNEQEIPLAERLVFAHFDKSAKVDAKSDKKVYKTREKVTLSLNPVDLNNASVVSVAVVHDSRFEKGKITDIESYNYLNSELSSVPHIEGTEAEKEKMVEDIILVKGWRKYDWEALVKANGNDTKADFKNLKYLGTITKAKKKISEELEIGVMSGQKIQMLKTSNNGTFDFNMAELYADLGVKLSLFINKNKNEKAYRLDIDNQFKKMSAKLAMMDNQEYKPPFVSQADNSNSFSKMDENAIAIGEVLVSREVARGASGPNACGDFVCFYNVLNCTAHYNDKRNTSPIAGRKYRYYGGGRGQQSIVYPGCTASNQDRSLFMEAEGIRMHKTFYADTYEDPKEPALYTTIYWNHALIVQKDKPSQVEFHTGDIEGKYKVIIQGVQGVGQNEVVYGQQTFEVKK